MSNPCLDGALFCRPIYQQDDYQCVCKPGFTGHYCETGQLLHWAVFFFSFYSLLVIPLINCSIKIKYYYNISRAQSHLILRELLWHASLVLSITRYTHTEYESIRSVNRVDRRPPEIYTWNRQWPLMKQKLGEIIGADASTFCLWHSDCDPYFLVRS